MTYGLCNNLNYYGHNYDLNLFDCEIDPETGYVMDPNHLKDLAQERSAPPPRSAGRHRRAPGREGSLKTPERVQSSLQFLAHGYRMNVVGARVGRTAHLDSGFTLVVAGIGAAMAGAAAWARPTLLVGTPGVWAMRQGLTALDKARAHRAPPVARGREPLGSTGGGSAT